MCIYLYVYMWCIQLMYYYSARRLPQWLSGKESACIAGDMGLIPGPDDPLEEGMATHSSILAWRLLWPEEPGGLQSIGSHRIRHNWEPEDAAHSAIKRINIDTMPEINIRISILSERGQINKFTYYWFSLYKVLENVS